MTDTFSSSGLYGLRRMYPELVGIVKTYGDARLAARSNPRVSLWPTADDVARAQKLAEAELIRLKAAALADIDASRQNAESHLAKARADIARAIGRPKPDDVNEQLLIELKEQRAWNRLKPRLDGVGGSAIANEVQAIAQEAMQADDVDTLSALRVELPAYMTLRGAPSWLPTAIEKLNNAMASASPKLQTALDAQAEIDAGWNRLSVAYTQARYAVETDADMIFLPGWTEDEFEQVSIGSRGEL